jgi:uncharacterized protein YjbI with pentapeptide repeats
LTNLGQRDEPYADQDPKGNRKVPATDISAVLDVIKRREKKMQTLEEEHGRYFDLSCTDLRGANLQGIRLCYVNLEETHLEKANLRAPIW